jgi:hypothetical protein
VPDMDVEIIEFIESAYHLLEQDTPNLDGLENLILFYLDKYDETTKSNNGKSNKNDSNDNNNSKSKSKKK